MIRSEPTLTGRALGGAVWGYSGAVVLVVTQIVSTMFTARLVSPSQFGAYASALTFTVILSYFTLNPIGNALLRQRQLGPRVIHTAFTLSILVTAGATVVMLAGAGLWASLWHIPQAEDVARVCAVGLFFNCIATVPLALLRHAFRFGTAAAIETGMQVVGAGIGVAGAASLHSAVALAMGQAAAAAGVFVLSVFLTRNQLGFALRRDERRELVSFSRKVSLLNLGFFGLYNVPAWYVGRAFGAASLGMYSRADVVCGLPLNYLMTNATKVLYPLYGRLRGDQARLRALISDGVTLLTGFSWPLLGLLAGSAAVVVRVLLGDRWAEAAPLLTIFCLVGAANILLWLLANAAEAFSWMKPVAVRQIGYTVALIVALVVVWAGDLSIHTMLISVAVIQAGAAAAMLGLFVARLDLPLRRLLPSIAVHATAGLAAYWIAAETAASFDDRGLALRVAAQCLAGALVLVGLLLARNRYPATRLLVGHIRSSRRLTGRSRDDEAGNYRRPTAVSTGVSDR
jgi:O-antigen/teichoic acid export membrane protein